MIEDTSFETAKAHDRYPPNNSVVSYWESENGYNYVKVMREYDNEGKVWFRVTKYRMTDTPQSFMTTSVPMCYGNAMAHAADLIVQATGEVLEARSVWIDRIKQQSEIHGPFDALYPEADDGG